MSPSNWRNWSSSRYGRNAVPRFPPDVQRISPPARIGHGPPSRRGRARRLCRSVRSGSEGAPMSVLVTGAAGFIGMHVSLALLARGERVIGIASLNSYYDPELKPARLAALSARNGFSFTHYDFSARAR